MITGSLVALVTPMDADGRIDWECLDKLVDYHVEAGTSAIVAVGTTGESSTLDPDEHINVIRRVVTHANGRIPVIAGTGGNSTHEAVDLTREAAEIGVDGCLLVVPYYNKPTQEGLYQHFRTVAEAVDVNQILYNVPGRTSCDMLNETVDRLADIPNIVGIKDATGNVSRGEELVRMVGDRIRVYSGDDGTSLELMLRGGSGNVSVTANVAPRLMAQTCEAAVGGDEAEARRLDEILTPLNRKLFLEANPIPVKWAMYEMGLIGSGIRLPMTPLSEEYRADVRDALKAAECL
ncbi:4-hydroxy-tetrahydrodipicolinate synthase [Halomonadaceae bacterium KBTZ08]